MHVRRWDACAMTPKYMPSIIYYTLRHPVFIHLLLAPQLATHCRTRKLYCIRPRFITKDSSVQFPYQALYYVICIVEKPCTYSTLDAVLITLYITQTQTRLFLWGPRNHSAKFGAPEEVALAARPLTFRKTCCQLGSQSASLEECSLRFRGYSWFCQVN